MLNHIYSLYLVGSEDTLFLHAILKDKYSCFHFLLKLDAKPLIHD